MPESIRPLRRVLAATLTSFVVAGSAAACTSDGDQKDSTPEGTPTASPGTPSAAAATLEVSVARVAGKLKDSRRQKLAEALTGTLQEYLDNAYLGDYPRADFANAFSTFRKGALDKAEKDRDLITGAAYADRESVEAKSLRARLSVFSPAGKAVGVTAQVRFALTFDGAPVVYAGRLLLTPEEGRWRIFGYDLKRNDTAGATQ